jgi:hypothetical protein
MPVANLAVTRATNDIRLAWSPVTTDTTGALIAVTRYHVYRGASPGFSPDKSGHTNRVGVVTAASFTDLGAAAAAGDLYYLVTAEGTSGLESARASNLGVRRRLRLTPPTGAQTSAWVSMPRTTGLAAAADLVTLWNGGAGAGPVVALARVDRETQLRQVWSYAGGRWTGTDFPIVPGDALEVTAGAPLDVLLTGAEDTNPAYGFAFHTQVGNLSWISLPQDVAYADAQAVVQAMNGGPGAGPITRVAWLDPASGQMQSWLWFAGAWRGTNFALQPGYGLAVLAGGDLPSWIPARLPH